MPTMTGDVVDCSEEEAVNSAPTPMVEETTAPTTNGTSLEGGESDSHQTTNGGTPADAPTNTPSTDAPIRKNENILTHLVKASKSGSVRHRAVSKPKPPPETTTRQPRKDDLKTSWPGGDIRRKVVDAHNQVDDVIDDLKDRMRCLFQEYNQRTAKAHKDAEENGVPFVPPPRDERIKSITGLVKNFSVVKSAFRGDFENLRRFKKAIPKGNSAKVDKRLMSYNEMVVHKDYLMTDESKTMDLNEFIVDANENNKWVKIQRSPVYMRYLPRQDMFGMFNENNGKLVYKYPQGYIRSRYALEALFPDANEAWERYLRFVQRESNRRATQEATEKGETPPELPEVPDDENPWAEPSLSEEDVKEEDKTTPGSAAERVIPFNMEIESIFVDQPIRIQSSETSNVFLCRDRHTDTEKHGDGYGYFLSEPAVLQNEFELVDDDEDDAPGDERTVSQEITPTQADNDDAPPLSRTVSQEAPTNMGSDDSGSDDDDGFPADPNTITRMDSIGHSVIEAVDIDGHTRVLTNAHNE
jgi:hypothetical protein